MIIPYPRISPIAFHIGPLAVRWYGIMYVLGYAVGDALAKWRSRRGLWTLDGTAIDSLIGYLVIGMLVGARLVYVFLYDWPTYRAQPLRVFALWNGGLSFHGAAIGMAVACGLFAWRRRVPWRMVADGLAVCATPGLFFGRIGNFINAELYGRPTDVPWAMVFPTDPLGVPRHPSQLYQAMTEGLVLGAVLFWIQSRLMRRARTDGTITDGYLSAAFLIGYGVLRFFVEFTREPDAQLGFVFGALSMGQLLCLLMIAVGIVLLVAARRGKARPVEAQPIEAQPIEAQPIEAQPS
jgi:phosphatidylglycerol:prolipoprotein diacylglycerol transferase